MDLKKSLSLIFTLIIVLFITVRCEYDHPTPIPSDGTPISFSGDIQPIFDEGCNDAGCHATGAIAPDLTAGNAYNSLFANNQIDTLSPEQSDLYKTVKTGTMSGYLSSAADADLILNWIKQGAKNN